MAVKSDGGMVAAELGSEPRRCRVRPNGEIIAVPDRGMFWGNRGSLHDQAGNLVRYSRGRAWVTCLLEFKGRHRTLWAPGRLTELFFLDEATALAAGHRPCAECRRPAYRDFQTAWAGAFPGETNDAPGMDARLHADRLSGSAIKRTYPAQLATLPDGVIIALAGELWLVRGDELLAWTPGGYGVRRAISGPKEVTVLTPQCTVQALVQGYPAELHPSAGASSTAMATRRPITASNSPSSSV